MIIAQTVDRPQIVAPTGLSLFEFGMDPVATVHDNPSVGKDIQMSRH